MSQSTRPQIHITEDGSPTLWTSVFEEHYHSMHGAIRESTHIFLQHALEARVSQGINHTMPIQIFEVGFGTGLNALLSALWSEYHNCPILYTSIERYPITSDVYQHLEFGISPEIQRDLAKSSPIDIQPISQEDCNHLLHELHQAPWGRTTSIRPNFHLHKLEGDLLSVSLPLGIDVIYFDAFSPESQPELWEEDVFHHLYQASRSGAILSTYCAKGEVRRRLQRVGYKVSRLAGPPGGKREILSAQR